MRKTYLILAIIAAIVIGVYLLMPNRYFVDTVFPLNDGASVIAYDDKGDGGSSNVEFSLRDSLLSFSCELGLDTSHGAWCGLVFDLSQGEKKKFRNWIRVDSISFDVDAHGAEEVLVKVWTYDPDVTKSGEIKTFKLLLKELPLVDGSQHIVIPMEQFYTPDFWYTDAKVDPSMNRRHLESVARIEIAPGWSQKRGKKFSLAIREISAKGVSNVGFGVVLFVILGLTIVAIGRRHSGENKDGGK